MNLLPFQQKAVEQLTDAFKRSWNQYLTGTQPNVERKIVFKSPTGSGKTFMVASFIDSLAKQPDFDEDLAFVWITFSDELAQQSREKYARYFYPNVGRQLLGVEDISPRGILLKNDILFLNWQKLVSRKAEDRKLRRPEDEKKQKECGGYFEDLVETTHAAGRKIVLIIDESHLHVTPQARRDVIQPLNPRVVLHVSATPKDAPEAGTLSLGYEFIEVKREDVITAGLIKEEIVSQTTEELVAQNGQDLDKTLLDLAITKKESLATEWKRIGMRINPLVLIQLPSDDKVQQTQQGEIPQKKDVVLEYLKEKGVPESKIALWFDNEKKNLAGISNDSSEVDFLLFKFAAGTGWDCPRAHVIVMYREIGNPEFKTQVLGRVMRNPVVEKSLENHPALRKAYLYTSYSKNALNEAAQKKDAPLIKTEKVTMSDVALRTLSSEVFAKKITKTICASANTSSTPVHDSKIPEIYGKIWSVIQKNTTATTSACLVDLNLRIDEALPAQNGNEMTGNIVKEIEAILDSYAPTLKTLNEEKRRDASLEIKENTQDFFEVINREVEAEFVLHPAMRCDFASRIDYGDFVSAPKFQRSFCRSMNTYFEIDENALDLNPTAKLAAKGIDISGTYKKRILTDTIFQNIDCVAESENVSESEVEVSDNDVEKEFALQCAEVLKAQTDEAAKIPNIARSWSVLKGALNLWFSEHSIKNYFPNETDNYRVFLRDVNNPAGSVFKLAITKALVDFSSERQQLLQQRLGQEVANAFPFKIKTDYSISSESEILETKLSIVSPFRIRKNFTGRANEEAFIRFIDAQESALLWWFKNQDSGKDGFSLRYISEHEGTEKMFYPDWILKFKDGRIGIFDTKGGITATNLDGRDKGLYRKIQEMNRIAKNPIFVGGIVVKANENWYYNDCKNYSCNPNRIASDPNWKPMKELFA